MDETQHPFAPARLALGQVLPDQDTQSRGRVHVKLLATQLNVWAVCVVPSAGANYGVALLPNPDEIVLLAFHTPEQWFVLGSVWSGQTSLPNEAAAVSQRYAIKTKGGFYTVFDDNAESITLMTPAQNSIVLSDSGNTCTVTVGTTTIQATTTGVNIYSSGSIEMNCASMTVTAQTFTVNCPSSNISGVTTCDTMIANAVVGSSYTPGVGNVW